MRLHAGLAALAAAALLAPAAGAQVPGGSVHSDNVEFVKNFVRHSDSSGARLLDGYFYITTERDLSIYDVKDPENPALVGNTTLAEPGDPTFSEEDPDTNGKVLPISNGGTTMIYDVSDKANIRLLSTLDGVDNHTLSCVLDCTWIYGSEGAIIDLRDPKSPKDAGNWAEGTEATSGGHDVTEVAPGLVLTSSQPMMLLDARTDPTRPTVLATGKSPGFLHAVLWPQMGKDDFILGGGEDRGPNCADSPSATFMTFDTRGWEATKTFPLLSEFKMENGTYADGRAPETTWCVHWFDEHPTYSNGGLVAIAWYEHGTRFVRISSDGKIEEIGYYLAFAGQTSAVYWISDKVLYTADYTRGFDILRFTGEVPRGRPPPAAPPSGGGGTGGTGGAGGAGPSKPAGPSFSDLIALPRSCTSARKFRVRVKRFARDPVVSATLRVNGRRVAAARGRGLKKGLRAKRLPRKRFSVQVEVRTKSGHKTAGQRIYKGCKRRSR